MNKLFIQDYERFTPNKYSLLSCIGRLLKNHELRYIFWGRKFQASAGIKKNVLFAVLLHYRRKYGLEIFDYQTVIGGGIRLIHPWNITVNANTVLGTNVTLYKGSTIAEIKGGKKNGVPSIGDNVTLYANSTVCGNVHIGNNVEISAGAFVNFDVSDNSVVIGNPGVIHKRKRM